MSDSSITPKSLSSTSDLMISLSNFREVFYTSVLDKRKDSLFEIVDALNSNSYPVHCLAHLSLLTNRSHHALYQGLRYGSLNETKLRELLSLVQPTSSQRPCYSVDATSWPRVDANTTPLRRMVHVKHKGSKTPLGVPGWFLSMIALQTPESDSWLVPIDLRFEHIGNHSTRVVEQIQRVCESRCDDRCPLFCLDSGYTSAAVTYLLRLRQIKAEVVIRLRSNQVFLHRPDKSVGDRKHGKRFELKNPKDPDYEFTFIHPKLKEASVSVFTKLHYRVRNRELPGSNNPNVEGTLLRVNCARFSKPMWLFYSGLESDPNYQETVEAYIHRFDIEHSFKFLKSNLGLCEPTLRYQESALLWAWLVIVAYVELFLLREVIKDNRLPWESKIIPKILSPNRVRRSFMSHRKKCFNIPEGYYIRGRGKGTPMGTKRVPRTRYKVELKT